MRKRKYFLVFVILWYVFTSLANDWTVFPMESEALCHYGHKTYHTRYVLFWRNRETPTRPWKSTCYWLANWKFEPAFVMIIFNSSKRQAWTFFLNPISLRTKSLVPEKRRPTEFWKGYWQRDYLSWVRSVTWEWWSGQLKLKWLGT